MKSFLKLAYEAGAQQALQERGLTKQAFGEGLGYRGLDLKTTARHLPTLVRADMADEAFRLYADRAGAALEAAKSAPGGRLARIGGAMVGGIPGTVVAMSSLATGSAPGALLGGAGAYSGAVLGADAASAMINKAYRQALATTPTRAEMLAAYIKGNTPTGRVARRAGIAGLAGAGLYGLLSD